MAAIVEGVTVRGSTVARNVIANNQLLGKKRTLMDQLKKDKDKNFPVMARNFYMSPVYFFGWWERDSDMEAQNFFLADPTEVDAKNTIKVYPSLQTKTDLPKKYRDCMPESLGITVMKTGFLSSLQFISAYYFRMWQVLYEGDKVSLFGMLTYDTHTGQASIDETIAMMAAGTKDAILKTLASEYFWECVNFGAHALVLLGCLAGFSFCVKKAFQRMRQLKLQADEKELALVDEQHKI